MRMKTVKHVLSGLVYFITSQVMKDDQSTMVSGY